MNGPLSGMRVVEGSAFIAAPLGGMTLAQLGADVIRFDPIGGGLDYTRWPITKDGQSLFWAGLNKGKRSIQIDLSKPEGQELAQALITAPGDDAGLFLTNFPPRGFLDYQKLKAKRADLIMLVVTGHFDGTSAVDYTVNCGVGFPFITGPGDMTEPVNHALPAWDAICGLTASTGMLAAERHRLRTGEGQLVTLALSDVAYAMAGNTGFLAELAVNDADRPRVGNYLYGAFGKDFETSDKRRVMIVGLTERQWANIKKATGLGPAFDSVGQATGLDLDDEGNRFRAREQLAAVIAPWIAARTMTEVGAIFDKAGVAWGPYRTFRQMVVEDPRVSEANPMFRMTDDPGIGRYLMPSSPLAFAGLGREPPRPAPKLGANTDEILSDILKLPSSAIAGLHDRNIVAG
ncbi:MAG TPA: CoA transferase [Alphaproteobacteria bacterium]|jgi:2-methylfumaryl-CoA isomerase|nr:CoA transferase [Alphaproteobacteria bacterium]